MRSRYALLALAAVILAVPAAAHAAIPFFGPIIPAATDVCPAGWGMLVVVINNIISLLITLAIVLVAPLMIAWAGFLLVINPVNPSKREEAKKILTNTIVGIVIALAGWLIVDAIMVVLYKPNAAGFDGKTWWSLVTSGGAEVCLPQQGALDPARPGVGAGGIVVAPSAQQLAARINAFQTAASGAGLRAVFEVGTESRKQELIAAGARGEILALGGHITGEHFSVYGSGGCGGQASAELKQSRPCPNCVSISGPSCKSSSSCRIDQSLLSGLQRISAANPSIGAWTVTEAYPPTTNAHNCSCHYTGTCIDAAFR